MDSILWELEGVTLRGTALPRLEGVSVEIRAGVTAVLGPSGAGKTSLLDLLVEFERPDAGTVSRRFDVGSHAMPVYWAPQSGGLWPHLNAREHLLRVMRGPGGVVEADRILALFDLADKAAAYPDEMSQGQRSRLSVARALAADPVVLVMDEPLVHVDTAQALRLWDVLRRTLSERGTSLVFATHSPETVLAEADRVIAIRDGRLLYEGPVEELYRRPPSRELAECLGEANWLEPSESRLWLGVERNEPACVRPEQLAVAPAQNGPIKVKSSRFKGGIAEVDLVHEPSGAVRKFFHRPSSNGLHAGDRVALKLLAMLLAVMLAGCGGSGDPAMKVRKENSWQLPPDGVMMPGPRSVAVGPQDETVIVDMKGRVFVSAENGTILRWWRMPETANGRPEGVVVMKDGRIAISDTHYHRVLFFDAEGKPVGSFGKEGRESGEFIFPVGITQDEHGFLYVCEYGSNDRVQKFTPEGKFVLSFGSPGTGPGQFERPSGMVAHGGKVYVADAMNNRISVFSDDGKFLGDLGRPERQKFHFPYDLRLAPDGAFYVVEYGASRVSKLSLDGTLLGRYGAPGEGEGQFRTPWGIAVNSKGRIIVADTGNHRIVELTP